MKAENNCPVCGDNLEYNFKQCFYYCQKCGFNHDDDDNRSGTNKSAECGNN